jgi:alpha-D-xyloside xylohydrolase
MPRSRMMGTGDSPHPMSQPRLLLPLLLAASAAFAGEVRFAFPTTAGPSDSIALDGFRRNGVDAGTPLSRTLAPGVTELTLDSPATAEWTFSVADDSAYYGLGERFDRLNHAHTVLLNASRDIAGEKGSISYQPIPFYMSLRGYGLWVDTTSEAVFDLNVTESARVLVKFYAPRLRIVLFQGPGFPAILERFTALVGRQELPPYWAFAPWKARDYHRDTKDVDEDIRRYRELGLPASILLIDSPWATNYNTYDINPKQFPDAKAMIARIHDAGFKLLLWHTPWINRQTKRPYEEGVADKLAPGPASNFAEADRQGYLLRRPDGSTYIGTWWKGTGGLIDFTRPAAREWWQGQVAKAIDAGADGFKDDDGEGVFVAEAGFSSGEDWRVMRNRYAVEYNRAAADVLRRKKGSDWVLFQRSGTVGSHAQPVFWSGDNDGTFSAANGLPSVVTAGLNAGMSGISLWVSDLGGYNKTARFPGDDVVFIRWTQYAAFSPGMEVMSAMNLGPWDYGEQALRLFRDYSVLHMSLFPYRYAAAMESARTGLPMMRSLVLMHQDDARAREADAEYYFGPDLLVSPVVTPLTQRAVYLPKGEWIDYWTGRRVAGEQSLVVEAPLDRIPLWVREGTVLPKIPEDVMTLVPAAEVKDPKVKPLDDRRVYELYPGQTARTFADFEGRSVRYDPKAGALAISGPPARLTIRWRFTAPESITVNGKPIEGRKSADGIEIEFAHQRVSEVKWE